MFIALVVAPPTYISDEGVNEVLVPVDAQLLVLEGDGHAPEATRGVVDEPQGSDGCWETEAPQTFALRVERR